MTQVYRLHDDYDLVQGDVQLVIPEGIDPMDVRPPNKASGMRPRASALLWI